MPKKLPLKDFLETFKNAPRAAISLLIKNEKGELLMTKRRDHPFAGSWHLPGSFILKGESIDKCIERICMEELGLQIHSKKKLIGTFDDIENDPRGHVIDIIYELKVTSGIGPKAVGLTSEVKFFKKLPNNIGFNHRETLNKLGY